MPKDEAYLRHKAMDRGPRRVTRVLRASHKTVCATDDFWEGAVQAEVSPELAGQTPEVRKKGVLLGTERKGSQN